jgi:hypothetical protein
LRFLCLPAFFLTRRFSMQNPRRFFKLTDDDLCLISVGVLCVPCKCTFENLFLQRLGICTGISAYGVRFWFFLILFLQSQNVYQILRDISERAQAEIMPLGWPDRDLCGLDLHIVPWSRQVKLVRKNSRSSSSAGSLVFMDE